MCIQEVNKEEREVEEERGVGHMARGMPSKSEMSLRRVQSLLP